MSSASYRYRKIDFDFLDKQWEQGFGVFCEVYTRGKVVNFEKVADYSPSTHEEIIELMGTKDKALYIHEADLIRYYDEVVFKVLDANLEKDQSDIERIRSIYLVSRRILNEYFTNISSNRILRSLGKVMQSLERYLGQGNFSFTQIFSITKKDRYLHTHSSNVGLYCTYLGVSFGMEKEVVRELGLGGMHIDIGMKSVPHEIQSKQGELSEEEFKMFRKHPASSKKTLSDMKCFSKVIMNMAAEHHEKFNGKGYPFGLAGEEISPFGRICSLMDVFDAMTCERPFRHALSPVQALKIMKNEMCGSFDPKYFNDFTKTLSPRK